MIEAATPFFSSVPGQTVIGIVGSLAATGLTIVLVKAGKLIPKFMRFLDDWHGEPERPGIAPARPGVLQRLHTLEEDSAETRTAVSEVRGEVAGIRGQAQEIKGKVDEAVHELKPNSGASTRDLIGRVYKETTGEEPPPPTSSADGPS